MIVIKKIMFMVFVSLLLLVPLNMVHAAEPEDLLSGKMMINARGYKVPYAGGSTDKITDGDFSTNGPQLSTNSGTYSYPYGFYYEFPSTNTISSIVVKGGSTISATLYGSSGQALSTTYFSATEVRAAAGTKKVIEPQISGVKGIYFANATGNQLNFITEVQLFGTKDPVVNTDRDKFVVDNLSVVANTDTGVKLSWNAINSLFFKGFNVYQDGVLLRTIDQPNIIVNDLTKGKNYTFRIAPVDINNEVFTGNTIRYTVPLPDTTPPEIPVLSGKAGNKKVDLKWNKSPDSDIAGFVVYQDSREIIRLAANDLGYTVTGLVNGTNYKFSVSAFDKSGNESRKSNEIALIPVAPPPPVTETGQEQKDGYLLVTWKKTEGATGYRVYLNGRLVGTVGPDVLEYKITRDMGYNPANLVNRAEARAVMEDGTEGGSNNPTTPGEGVLDDALSFLKIDDMIATSIAFLAIYAPWIILILAVIFSPVLYGLVVKLMNYSRRKTDVPAVKGTVLNPYEKRR